jgi:hypothetical protein
MLQDVSAALAVLDLFDPIQRKRILETDPPAILTRSVYSNSSRLVVNFHLRFRPRVKNSEDLPFRHWNCTTVFA